MTIKKRLETYGLLALETLMRPHWAYYHLWSYVDQRVLLQFHQERHSTQNLYFRSLEEILLQIHGANGKRALRTIKAAEGLCTNNEMRHKGVISSTNDASSELQRLVFCVASLMCPDTIVEVGVGRGATTKALLLALMENKKGHLYSIEFPSLRRRYREDIGILVPAELRKRWTLIIGPSQLELPRLLDKLGNISLFVHDGAHSFHIQRQDYMCAISHLSSGGVLVSDDISNDSFFDVSMMNNLDSFLLRQPKKDPIGIALKRS